MKDVSSEFIMKITLKSFFLKQTILLMKESHFLMKFLSERLKKKKIWFKNNFKSWIRHTDMKMFFVYDFFYSWFFYSYFFLFMYDILFS